MSRKRGDQNPGIKDTHNTTAAAAQSSSTVSAADTDELFLQNLNNKSLAQWLEEQRIDSSIRDKMHSYLVNQCEYTDKELSNIREQLCTHGRLFLNNVLIAYKQSGGSHDKAIFSPLSAALETIERKFSPTANFIWVGRPTPNKNELIGIRTLNAAMPNQKMCFWVLDEQVENYNHLMQSLGLSSNIEVVSIEKYAKKLETSINDLIAIEAEKIQLVKNIKFFLSCSKKRMSETTDPEKKEIERANAIREIVTVVNYVKTMIPYFERAGYVFDVDIVTLSPKAGHTSETNTLPRMSSWVFPTIHSDTLYDVWFYHYLTGYQWSGEPENYPDLPAQQNESTNHNRFVKRIDSSAKCTMRYYKNINHSLSGTLEEDYLKKESINSNAAIMQLTARLSRGHDRDDWAASDQSFSGEGTAPVEYLVTEPGNSRSSSPAPFKVMLFPGLGDSMGVISFSLPGGLQAVKYYNQSYSTLNSLVNGRSTRCLNRDLLFISDGAVLEETLSKRCRFSAFDVCARYNITVIKLAELDNPNNWYGERNCRKFVLKNITMLHQALLTRPDHFSTVLKYAPLDKIAGLLSMKVEVPTDIFVPYVPVEITDTDTESKTAESHTLLSLATKIAPMLTDDCRRQILETLRLMNDSIQIFSQLNELLNNCGVIGDYLNFDEAKTHVNLAPWVSTVGALLQANILTQSNFDEVKAHPNLASLATAVDTLLQQNELTNQSFFEANADAYSQKIKNETKENAKIIVPVAVKMINEHSVSAEYKIRKLCAIGRAIMDSSLKEKSGVFDLFSKTGKTEYYQDAMTRVKESLLAVLAQSNPGVISKEDIELAKSILGEHIHREPHIMDTSSLSHPALQKHEDHFNQQKKSL